jgi:RNA polymerase sigma-70 factor, ECF subfamily
VDYSSFEDSLLMQLIAKAQSEALSELYDRYSRLVYSLALHTLGDPVTAEEVTQDVFFRVWEKASTYRSDQAKVSTWLVSITRNRAIDMLRRRGIRAEGHSIAWEEQNDASLARTNSRTPEEVASQAIQGQEIRDAIARLPADQQRVLALAFFSGLSHSEIAAQLGEPLGTVKTRIRMAMQKLRSWLEEEQWVP